MRKQLRRAFTLIELLTVIAIIAILTAIIFPVFATVRENARQSSSLSNLHAISAALGQFQLDNHRYPDVLFGYVYHQYNAGTKDFDGPAVAMDKAYSTAQADAADPTKLADVSIFFRGLYPEYVHDFASFRDPNNPSNGDYTATTGKLPVNVLCSGSDTTTNSANDACVGKTGGTLVAAADTRTVNSVQVLYPHEFYAADAYDTSPQVTGTNTLSKPPIYVARYQSSWTDVNNSLIGNVNYTHQMRWKNPPADTYVTSTTYHVPNADTVLVLWEGGSARKLSTQQFGADATTVATTGTPGISQANFWKLTPAQ